MVCNQHIAKFNVNQLHYCIHFQAAAVERLEESKSKIEGLLDWLSNIGNENESSVDHTDPFSKENGNLPEETSSKRLISEHDDANGNAFQSTDTDSCRESSGKNNVAQDLDQQFHRVKVQYSFCSQEVILLFVK